MDEPMSREERKRFMFSMSLDRPQYVGVSVGDARRLDATVQAAEDLADFRLRCADALHAEWIKAAAERDALVRRVEALRAALVMARTWVIDDFNLAKIDAALADDEASTPSVGAYSVTGEPETEEAA